MAADFHSKHAIVRHPREELFMSFVDMRNFLVAVPEDKKDSIKADYDHISASIQGFSIGVKVTSREPYSRITLQDDGAPFKFTLTLNFKECNEPGCCEFFIDVEAELNLLMRKMAGGKIQEALDSIVDKMAQ